MLGEPIFFLFIERDEARAKMLEEVVSEIQRPDTFRVKVVGGKHFAEGFDEVHQFYAAKGQPLPPTFAFIDPFGWTGIPFPLVRKILSYPSCEVLVNFMYEEVNRFIQHPDQEANLDQLFGCRDWRNLELGDKSQRRKAIHGLYQHQLGTAAEYVRSFEMRNRNDATDYFLFFATNSLKGLKKMKEAMWRADERGEFTFSDATVPEQGLLFEKEPRLDMLRRLIVTKFSGQEVTVDEVETFVVAETPFRETHYKKVLATLEMTNHVAPVNVRRGRRAGTFGDGSMVFRFSK